MRESSALATPTSSSAIPSSNAPLAPLPPASRTQSSHSTHAESPQPPNAQPVVTPPAPQSPVRKPRRIFRKLFITLLILSVAGFGSGVYYSRINDNFHDFFTEYIPFGEEAVLYFEEQELKKRYPRFPPRSERPRDTREKVTIPSQSGVSWKVTGDDKAHNGGHTNTLQQTTPNPTEPLHLPTASRLDETVKEVEIAKKRASPTATPGPIAIASKSEEEPKPTIKTTMEESKPPNESTVVTDNLTPRVSESLSSSEAPPIELVSVDTDEPLVRHLAKIVNDIIVVVNADNSNAKFSSTINKAKLEITKAAEKVQELKDTAGKDADEKVKAAYEEFDRAARELIHRVEGEMHAQETQWREEYESERQRLQQVYEQKLKTEIDRTSDVNEKRLRNELLEQAVEMKRKFIADVKDRVEMERNSRLGKISDLSNAVNELESLLTACNSVVDTNLKTQHLLVTVEAVRSHIKNTKVPQPFIRELAALKEIAADDPVVNAAIASINPAAYQHGIFGLAQLIDRFRRVAAEVHKASLLPENAGVASHASSFLLSKLLFRKKGFASGDDVQSVLTRAEIFLEEGNLDQAAREMNGLSGWAKTLSKDWLSEVRKVLEVQQALDVSLL